MLMIFPYSSVFCSDERLFTLVKTQFFAVRQDQTTLLLLLSIHLRQELYMNGLANS